MKIADLHQQTAAQLFQVPVEQVTYEQRQLAKQHNYWGLYSTPQTLERLVHATT